jgi:hypothetical protein
MSEPAPTAATSPKFQPVSTQPQSRKPVAAKIAGIVGIVICLVIIVIVWFSLGTVSRAVDNLGTTVNSGFDRAIITARSMS